ncbi:MAG TPA: zinc-binding dehydrogenase [Chloroflexota bacterium]|jgi:threonine dehydrogenase-like Zn-dependent dehydrogenase
MRGVVFLGQRRLAIRDFADPTPGPAEAVIRIGASGICGSDLAPYRGAREQQHVSGHEPCGTVAALGDGVTGWRVGDRVIVHHYSGCGVCRYCRIGYDQLCLQGHETYGFGSDGGNADCIRVPARCLVPLPAALSFAEGAAIACGTGTAYMALKKLDISGRDTLAIYGQGPVGLSAMLLGKAMGARIIAVDLSPERLALAQGLGADVVLQADADDPVSAIRALTAGEGADATLDCTGNATARAQTVRSARVFGRACFVGEGGTVTLEPSPDIIHRHLTLYGSWTFPTVGLDECARWIVDRRIPLERLITHRFRLDEAPEAFRTFEGGATGKCVFLMEE